MAQHEYLFVFFGVKNTAAANTLSMMAKAQMVQSDGAPARIVLLSKSIKTETTEVLDFTLPPPGGYIVQSPDEPITLHINEDTNLTVCVFGNSVIEQTAHVKKQLTVLDPYAVMDDPEFDLDVDIDLLADVILAQKAAPEVEFEFIEIPLLESISTQKKVKPIGDFLLKGKIIEQPNKQSVGYINADLLKLVSQLVGKTETLEFSLASYDNALEIIEYLSSDENRQQKEGEVLAQFNALACNHRITELAMSLVHSTSEDLNLAYEVNQESLDKASVFVPLMYKKGISLIREEEEAQDPAFRVVFHQPIANLEGLIATIEADLQIRGTVCYYHELNKKMLSEKIFGYPVDVPTYNTNSFENELKLLTETNLIQEHLERKEQLIASHKGAQLRRCLALLLPEDAA